MRHLGSALILILGLTFAAQKTPVGPARPDSNAEDPTTRPVDTPGVLNGQDRPRPELSPLVSPGYLDATFSHPFGELAASGKASCASVPFRMPGAIPGTSGFVAANLELPLGVNLQQPKVRGLHSVVVEICNTSGEVVQVPSLTLTVNLVGRQYR